MKQETQDNLTGLPPVTEPLRLYMPLRAELYERDEYDYMESDAVWLDGQALAGYADSIRAALLKNRLPEETERGLMHWYHEADTVNDKVTSVFFTAEVREGQLWGVAECELITPLTPEELTILCEYISGQASDGWGESFEQRKIHVNEDTALYVHLWNSDNWSILTEKERFSHTFAKRQAERCGDELARTVGSQKEGSEPDMAAGINDMTLS